MDKALFKEFTESIKEAGQIRRGKRLPARQRHLNGLDVKAIRRKTGLYSYPFNR